MITDLNKLALDLRENPDHTVLVDGGYLEMDLKAVFDYYKDVEPENPMFIEYCKTYSEYEFMKFANLYLRNLLKSPVDLSYTEDDWLQIRIQK